jgi:hypothetical protein
MVTTEPAKQRTPPAEEFWQRYSPHHEFPVSSITSVALHILVIVTLLLGAWAAIRLGLGNKERGLPITITEISDGTPDGVPQKKGVGAGPLDEEVGDNPTPQKEVKPVELVKLPESNLDPIDFHKYKDNEGKRLIDPGAVNPVLDSLQKLDEQARKKLVSGLGGQGASDGSPNGSPDGKKLSKRIKRLLRWSMIFNTRDGNDYATQLDALGAILAVPAANGKEYEVIRDLKTRPVQGKVEDLASIKSIYWIDDKPDSVGGLARALGIKTNPKLIVAFFPVELESKLAQMERDFAGRKEDDIAETRFDIIRSPNGYEPKVNSQSAKP